jgi:adenylate kinase
MHIVLLGAPGSGKGTLSRYLVDRFQYQHISTGDLFRKNVAEETPLGLQLKNVITRGELVSDDITNAIVKNALTNALRNKKNLILDGYPRTLTQAQFLDEIINIDLVLLLNVDKEIAVKRIIGRRICSQCKKIYNIYFDPPKVEGICDLDGSILTQRKDDNIQTINDRFINYEQTKTTLVDYYQAAHKLHQIDSNINMSRILPSILKLINR